MSENCTISLSSTKLGFQYRQLRNPSLILFLFNQLLRFLSSYYDQYCKNLSTYKHLTFTAHVCIPVLFLPSKEKLLLLDKEWLAKVAVISQPEENAIYPTYKTQSLGEQERRQIPQATPNYFFQWRNNEAAKMSWYPQGPMEELVLSGEYSCLNFSDL